MNGKYFLTALSLILSVGGSLTACSGDRNAQDWFAPNPELQGNSPALDPSPSSSPSPASTPRELPLPTSKEIKDNKLPPNFPKAIPIYTRAKLLESQYRVGEIKGETRWQTEADRDTVAAFYRQEFEGNNWEFNASESNNTLLVASQDNLNLKLSIPPASESDSGTIFLLEYASNLSTAKGQATQSKSEDSQNEKKPENSLDLKQVSPQVRGYIEDFAALELLPKNFDPNKTITRREYARWLFEVHNTLYRDRATKQIRPVTSASQPAFTDIKAGDRDFAMIQGLAEAGIIPSRLSQNTEALLFQPDAPLTREILILWKVPLDLRKALPSTSIDAVQKTWGFQDSEQIQPKALKAVFVDFENGENANILRAFGYTTLFQPKKAVTGAEAAAALWYFGYQGDGISAKEILALESSQEEKQ
ncbi:S-layer homology domain-containing protein [Spirulina sp. 06S082]|uniref:S-layer homology domain-containing protein n=1 Tax=Spirulina sp. 06S082 TaxID=3110248 RepID=UPI002B20D499|nr:S-layer homology domain-containing protein [Spirulina sp. 06S082]MEA5469403.1 S-layer homology domain-containing protein [Spirulina sp. 06S082]